MAESPEYLAKIRRVDKAHVDLLQVPAAASSDAAHVDKDVVMVDALDIAQDTRQASSLAPIWSGVVASGALAGVVLYLGHATSYTATFGRVQLVC